MADTGRIPDLPQEHTHARQAWRWLRHEKGATGRQLLLSCSQLRPAVQRLLAMQTSDHEQKNHRVREDGQLT
jgi:hypothetical protein